MKAPNMEVVIFTKERTRDLHLAEPHWAWEISYGERHVWGEPNFNSYADAATNAGAALAAIRRKEKLSRQQNNAEVSRPAPEAADNAA